jgi:SAM-dependent methyltransferase
LTAIYADGRHYDLLYSDDGEDIELILRQAKGRPGVVLELACGTGRFVVPLAREGHEVIGIDNSASMLAEARRKASLLGLAPQLIEADMRDFDVDARASLIFIAGNSLCHLCTNDDVAACLSSVRRHLDKGGRFLIDVFVPAADLLARSADERFPYGEYEHPDGGRVVITCSVRYDPIAQLNHVTLFRRIGDRPPEPFGSLCLRMFFPQELQMLLRHHGFRVESVFGDFHGGALTPASTKQLVLCSVL